jgi:hypothetical protein
MKNAISIERIGNFWLRIDDLVEALRKGAVLKEFEPWQLEQVRAAMNEEIDRRKKKDTT